VVASRSGLTQGVPTHEAVSLAADTLSIVGLLLTLKLEGIRARRERRAKKKQSDGDAVT
jgi:hypothetical protein